MSDYCKNNVIAYKQRMVEHYPDLYNKNPAECVEKVSLCRASHAAWRYMLISHCIDSMGGFANFKAHCRRVTFEMTGVDVDVMELRKQTTEVKDGKSN